MMPISRCGNQASTLGGNTSSCTPTKAKNSPHTPRLNATGKPSSKNTISPANMTGAKLATTNSIACAPASARAFLWCGSLRRLPLGAQRLGQRLRVLRVAHAAHRVRPLPSDIVSGAYASSMCDDRTKENILFIDIGTNGEMILKTASKLIATSCAVDPALKEMNISCGMRADIGAIDNFSITEGGIAYKIGRAHV